MSALRFRTARIARVVIVLAAAAACSREPAAALPKAAFADALEQAELAALVDDEGHARRLFAEACRTGSPRACLSTAYYEHFGVGGAEDEVSAQARVKAHLPAVANACAAGIPADCRTQGLIADTSMVGNANRELAVHLFRKACDGGDSFGCHNLAVAYAQGRGVDADPARAAAYFGRACERRDRSPVLPSQSSYPRGWGCHRTTFERRPCDVGPAMPDLRLPAARRMRLAIRQNDGGLPRSSGGCRIGWSALPLSDAGDWQGAKGNAGLLGGDETACVVAEHRREHDLANRVEGEAVHAHANRRPAMPEHAARKDHDVQEGTRA